MTRRVAFLFAFFVVIGACGGEATPLITTTVAGLSTTTTTTAAETTTTVDAGPLAGLVTAGVEDPFYGTGYHSMDYGDATHTYLLSVDSLTGPDPTVDRLGIALLDPAPVTTGTGTNQYLVTVWVEDPSEEIPASGVALYTLGPDGWELYVNVDARAVLGFLETTTDYDARRPTGPPAPAIQLVTFDWTGSAHFVADVSVFDLGDVTASAPAYQGQVECGLADILECVLLSDDGVLRPGDTGEAVEQMQDLLIALGYLSAPSDGVYDGETEDGVRAFQRDYRLVRDGKAGPQTLDLLDEVTSGESDIVMASKFGVGTVLFNTESVSAWNALKDIFGTPDAETGWYVDGCDGHQWWKTTWDGFTVIFTDRSGSKRFDGWYVSDLNDVPSYLYFAGGLRPGSTWAYTRALGATWDPTYGGFFTLDEFGYNNGDFVVTPPYPTDPPDSAVLESFGTGTGAFVTC